MCGNAYGHGVAATRDGVGYQGRSVHHQGERPGPEGSGQRGGIRGNPCDQRGEVICRCQVADQRMVAGPALRGKDGRHRNRVEGIGPEPVDGLGGERHQASGGKRRGARGDGRIVGGCQGHGVTRRNRRAGLVRSGASCGSSGWWGRRPYPGRPGTCPCRQGLDVPEHKKLPVALRHTDSVRG